MASFGEQIRKYRKAKKMTQDELAEAAGLHRVTLANYETGRKDNPSAENVAAIASALGVSILQLVGEESVSRTPELSDADVKFALFGGDAARITDEQFEEVKRFAKYIAQREAGK